ncbi:glyoxalase [Burkholderia pseudomallei]|nr:VOC family protein [Burkholderia pseudomallei]ARM04483.1 glyoxalase [Burkholderia pseudomallei]
MNNTLAVPAPSADTAPVGTVLGLHHFAWRCRDAEETRQFYEDVLGLPLVHVIKKDHVPSTGEYCPYVHIFFRMFDGSHVAFFDLGDGQSAAPSANTPAWVNHIALRVESRTKLDEMKARLIDQGVDVLGVTDHDGYLESIYFFDPNGFRLELTTEVAPPDVVNGFALHAHEQLAQWTAESVKYRTASKGGA